jgi:glycosyltransferase involved in cell wall biosynthesis
VTGASQTKDLFKEESALRERWQGSRELELKAPTGFTIKAPSVSKLRNLDWLLCADPSQSARLVMPTTNRQLTIAIRCPAPSGHERFAWGDYHYGLAMCSAIEKLGHKAVIEFREDWSNTQSAGDVILHLRGIIDLKPVQGRVNLVWVISHPDKIRAEEIAAMDRVFVAGPHLKKYFRQRFGVDAYVLLQGTDQTRFRRERSRHPAVSNKALFIGNSRMQIRPVVADSIQKKLPLLVYGKDWENFIPSSFIGGEYIANEDLVDWYGSAAVVLNDHWPTMREFGIVSNRIFDVVAAGRPVVTDPVDGLDELFLGAAEAYADADQLPEMFGRLGKRSFPEAAKLVRAKHTIEHRVQDLLREVGIKPR